MRFCPTGVRKPNLLTVRLGPGSISGMSNPSVPNAQDPRSAFDQPLGYVVVCSADVGGTSHRYSPLLAEQVDEAGSRLVTLPHGISRTVAAALPGLWYTLHLPSTLLDLVAMDAPLLKAAQEVTVGHHILLLPVDVFEQRYVDGFLRGFHRTVVVCPDELLEEVRARSEPMGFALPVTGYASLTDETLTAQWEAVHHHFVPGIEPLGRNLTLTRRLDLAPTLLPHRRLARQMGWTADQAEPPDHGTDDLVLGAVYGQALLAEAARLDDEGRRPKLTTAEEARHLRFPLTLALPGVAPAYSRTAYSSPLRTRMAAVGPRDEPHDVWSVTMHERSDRQVERCAIEFAATHHAVATSGLGLMMPDVPAQGFIALAELERHFTLTHTESPATVRKLLRRLNEATSSLWSEDTIELIKRASRLTVFSNFPLGLLTMPGDTSPLSARLPITYRPLVPLARTIQHEINTRSSVNLGGSVRVLIAECIPSSDPVGQLSRLGWSAAMETMQPAGDALKVDTVEIDTVDALRRAVIEHAPDFLVISAHGSFNGNVAGLVIGDRVCVGLGLGPAHAPPVVLLSACHVAPRGAGAITVTDLLLREGALAVLGTQVPVDVRRNAVLMARFFANVAAELKGPGRHATLLDLWHYVQGTNAVNDIFTGSQSLRDWSDSISASGVSVLEDFMMNRSVGRLRGPHVYQNTEHVLGEIADDMGMGPKVRNWFRRPGYTPESLFYLFAGRPDRIRLAHAGGPTLPRLSEALDTVQP